MKKIITIIFTTLLSIMMFSAAGCDLLFEESDDKDADNKFESFVQCLDNNDYDGIKSLFSQNIVADTATFDNDLDELLNYYDGDYVSYFPQLHGSGRDKDSGIEKKWYTMSYDVTTSEDIYRMAFIWYAKDTGDSGNVGIHSFYIIKAEDDPNYPQYSYGGDGLWTNGINIGLSWEILD
ncbi:MAG: DUF5104 domain-containing protein [Clostridia bacterium]|nr:DUF5104 domain-containing protein [Clostridia bacterium]